MKKITITQKNISKNITNTKNMKNIKNTKNIEIICRGWGRLRKTPSYPNPPKTRTIQIENLSYYYWALWKQSSTLTHYSSCWGPL